MEPDEAAALEAAIDEYQRSERPRLREHFQTMYVFDRIERTTFEARRWIIEEYLKETGADESLEHLVAKGCDRHHIINLLAMMDSDYVPPKWLGFNDQAALRRAAKKLREAEKIVGRIQPHTSLTRHLAEAWHWFAMFPILPRLMENYCSFVEIFLKSDGRVVDPGRELLVKYVVLMTNTPCDREVASLIAALPNRRGYSIEAHAKWRSRNPFLQHEDGAPSL